MKLLFICLTFLFVMTACNNDFVGSYKYYSKTSLGKTTRLTLFPDSTYQHVWWSDIIMSDQGLWKLHGDTLTLGWERHKYIWKNGKLYPIDLDGNEKGYWEFKKYKNPCDSLFKRYR